LKQLGRTGTGRQRRRPEEDNRMIGYGALACLLTVLAAGGALAQDGVQFLDALTDEPIELEYRPEQEITPAVEQFHATGENPYAGDQQATAEGQEIYEKWCQACHLPDGTGRIGPSLADDTWSHRRTGTDVGRFEIIYAGGAGAMQAFGNRLDQDEILKLVAFLETLQKQ
jgi:cytochrome c-L